MDIRTIVYVIETNNIEYAVYWLIPLSNDKQ